ncbi:MAG: hypothetical protein KF878_32005 [Planctomycetes bacterium]|nr:hypothetical protein [Planctomycetota bacterium]
MSDPLPEPSAPATTARDRAGLVGFGCLALLAGGGGLGGAALLLLGIGGYARAATSPLARAEDAPGLLDALERAVVLCGAGALLLLIGIVAAVVLLKELGDDAARARRGPA